METKWINKLIHGLFLAGLLVTTACSVPGPISPSSSSESEDSDRQTIAAPAPKTDHEKDGDSPMDYEYEETGDGEEQDHLARVPLHGQDRFDGFEFDGEIAHGFGY